MKKFIILASLFAMIAQGMTEKYDNYGHIRMCSAPGGLWSLEKECCHHRMPSAPDEFKFYANQKSEVIHIKNPVLNLRSKKIKPSNSQKTIDKKPSKVRKSKPNSKFHNPSISVKKKIIEAKNQQRKTDLVVTKILKKKSFEEKFTKFLGNYIGKFFADIFETLWSL
jgi:hypothetical protein